MALCFKQGTQNPFQVGQISNLRSISQRHLLSAKFAAVKNDIKNYLKEYSELLHILYLSFSNDMNFGSNSKKRMHRSHSNICWVKLNYKLCVKWTQKSTLHFSENYQWLKDIKKQGDKAIILQLKKNFFLNKKQKISSYTTEFKKFNH